MSREEILKMISTLSQEIRAVNEYHIEITHPYKKDSAVSFDFNDSGQLLRIY